MQEGIEPTISTIPLGCNNKIVSGDQPSTVSRNHPQHTISFSSKYDWIPCGVIATDSNHSLSFLSVNRNEGILVSLTGNFCGYPKAPSTPLLIFWQLVCLSTLHLLSLLVKFVCVGSFYRLLTLNRPACVHHRRNGPSRPDAREYYHCLK